MQEHIPLSRAQKQLILAASALAIVSLLGWAIVKSSTRHDLSYIKEHDTWFRSKYRDTIPLYISTETTPEIFAHISNRAQRDTAGRAIDQLAEPADASDEKRAGKHPVSCAVVGNSGNLRGSGYGPFIDSHVYIFRMNNGPVNGYAQDVGSRTTHNVIHNFYSRLRPYKDHPITLLYNDVFRGNYVNELHWDRYLQEVSLQMEWIAVQLYPAAFADVPPPDRSFPGNVAKLPGGVRIINPAFMRYIGENWFDSENQDNPGTSNTRPSTGFRTLIIAMQLCDSIDAFGFGVNANGIWDYYYDKEPAIVTRTAPWHQPDYQERFLEELERRGIIRLYRGNALRQ